MKTITLLILFFLISPQLIWCQSSGVVKIKKEINDFAVFDYYEKGASLASKVSKLETEEILEIIKTGNTLEQIYAFWALAKFKKYDYTYLIPKLIADTSHVKLNQIGCLVYPPISKGKIIFDLAENPQNRFGEYQIYPDFLDSLALTNHGKIEITNILNQRLFNVQKSEANYLKIRKKGMQRVTQAYAVLSEYQNERDIPLFKNLLKEHSNSTGLSYILGCIKKFTHEDFEEDILHIFKKQLKQKYPYSLILTCEVLLNYNSKESEDSLKTIILNPNKYYYQVVCLWLAVEKTNDLNHPLRKMMITLIGEEEIKMRKQEFNKLEYFGKARREREKN